MAESQRAKRAEKIANFERMSEYYEQFILVPRDGTRRLLVKEWRCPATGFKEWQAPNDGFRCPSCQEREVEYVPAPSPSLERKEPS